MRHQSWRSSSPRFLSDIIYQLVTYQFSTSANKLTYSTLPENHLYHLPSSPQKQLVYYYCSRYSFCLFIQAREKPRERKGNNERANKSNTNSESERATSKSGVLKIQKFSIFKFPILKFSTLRFLGGVPVCPYYSFMLKQF